MRELIAFTHALADETRWRLLRLLFDEPLCVCELADILELPQSSASSHLQILRRAALLESERRGKWIYYRVARARRPLLKQLSDTFRPDRRVTGSSPPTPPGPGSGLPRARSRVAPFRTALLPSNIPTRSTLMNLREFKDLLETHSGRSFRLLLPDGNPVPVSFHVTEVGRIRKTFLDCGGTLRETDTCQLQVWVGEDDDHRLAAGKLARSSKKPRNSSTTIPCRSKSSTRTR